MKFSTVLFAAAAFVGFSSAQAPTADGVKITNLVLNNVTAGEPFTITWANATGPVDIILKNGDRDDLKDVETIASGRSGNSFTWNVPSDTPADTYAFEIKDSEGNNYSIQWELIGGAAASSSASSGSASSTASSSANSTSTSSSASASATGANNATMTRSPTRTPTGSATNTASESDSTADPTGTSAPDAGGMASGFTSNLAFVFLAVGALMTLN